MFAQRTKRARSSSPSSPPDPSLASPLDLVLKRRRRDGSSIDFDAPTLPPGPDSNPGVERRRNRQWESRNAPSQSSQSRADSVQGDPPAFASASASASASTPAYRPGQGQGQAQGNGWARDVDIGSSPTPASQSQGAAQAQTMAGWEGARLAMRGEHEDDPGPSSRRREISSSPVRHEPPGSSPFRSGPPSQVRASQSREGGGEGESEGAGDEGMDVEMDMEELDKEWGEYSKANSLLYELHRTRTQQSAQRATPTGYTQTPLRSFHLHHHDDHITPGPPNDTTHTYDYNTPAPAYAHQHPHDHDGYDSQRHDHGMTLDRNNALSPHDHNNHQHDPSHLHTPLSHLSDPRPPLDRNASSYSYFTPLPGRIHPLPACNNNTNSGGGAGGDMLPPPPPPASAQHLPRRPSDDSHPPAPTPTSSAGPPSTPYRSHSNTQHAPSSSPFAPPEHAGSGFGYGFGATPTPSSAEYATPSRPRPPPGPAPPRGYGYGHGHGDPLGSGGAEDEVGRRYEDMNRLLGEFAVARRRRWGEGDGDGEGEGEGEDRA